MEANLETLGGSLHVPCVQELAKESLTAVPARYIRPDQDPPITSYSSLPDVPIIDMEKLLSGDQMELKKLDSACKEWGFFQLINHGVSSALLEKVKLEINEFFNLPMEEKKKFWQNSRELEGFGQAFVVSEEQNLDWGDMFALTTLPTHLRKPHLFPKLPLPFRDTLDSYANELKLLAVKILDIMSKALQMKTEEMRDVFEDGRQIMRMNYYPPCPQPEKVNGFTPHSDGSRLTILLQINEMEGLQIKKDGMWVPVKPLPETFVVNVGNILELINHGVSSALLEKAKMEINEFFNLPMEEKKKFWQDSKDYEGFGQAFVFSEEQKLDWADMFALTTLPTHLRKPHLFPKLPLPFRDTLDNYANELKHLAMKILDFISKALKMKTEEMRDLFKDGRQAMRMNYYPPCPQPEKVIGFTPHSDSIGLTILLQINEVEGLQIRKDGEWTRKPGQQRRDSRRGQQPPASPNRKIVTNGVYRSIEHRAVVNSRKERLSIATAYGPGYDEEMGPAPSMVTPQTPALFRRIRVAEYFKGLFAQKLDGKSYCDAMRIQNQSQES